MSSPTHDYANATEDEAADLPPIDIGTWDDCGECPTCGAPLPPQKCWIRAGQQWQSVLCWRCGTWMVDDEDMVNVYPHTDTDALDQMLEQEREMWADR